MSRSTRSLPLPSLGCSDVWDNRPHAAHTWFDASRSREYVRCGGVPQCVNPGCERPATYDSEPPHGGYFSTCDRCTTHSAAGLHAHRHSFTPAQAAANGGPREWTTATILRPVVEADEIVSWECREPLPNGRGACGYSISAADMDAHRAFRRGEMFLCDAANRANYGHGIGRDTNGHEVWAAFKEMRDAWNAAHPDDVR